ncbi:MAG: hypothetical protein IPH35_18065 [Rhodoferax sp.]|nr:hypothetical protein [Rhodoferax sp.]
MGAVGDGGYLLPGAQAKIDLALEKFLAAHGWESFINAQTDHTGLPKGQQTLSGGSEGRKLNAQTGEPDAQTKLITRLANDRRSAFADAGPEGVYGGAGQTVSFGPARDAQGLFLLDTHGAHSFVIPAELLSAARKKLTEYPADRAADVTPEQWSKMEGWVPSVYESYKNI